MQVANYCGGLSVWKFKGFKNLISRNKLEFCLRIIFKDILLNVILTLNFCGMEWKVKHQNFLFFTQK